MANEMVTVSLLQPIGYRDPETGEVARYLRGHRKMPLAHAQALGLLHRIVEDETAAEDEAPTVFAFEDVFDERLVTALRGAGYEDLEALAGASRDEILAIDGVGPAAFERIVTALQAQGIKWIG